MLQRGVTAAFVVPSRASGEPTEETVSLQIHHLGEEEVPVVAHQLLAGLHLAS